MTMAVLAGENVNPDNGVLRKMEDACQRALAVHTKRLGFASKAAIAGQNHSRMIVWEANVDLTRMLARKQAQVHHG